MRLVFVTNYFNHHQKPLADELYSLTSGDFRFIEMIPMPDSFKTAGYPEYDESPMLVKAWRQPDVAHELILNADVVLYGVISDYNLIKRRLKAGKLTFEVGERWLKRGVLNLLSPRLIKHQLLYHSYFFNKPLYRLNASAYAANDFALMHSFKGKMFKWGYFTGMNCDKKNNLEASRDVSRLKILYVSRFLILKHPELPVMMAKRLRDMGYEFELNMYGSGPELERIKQLISSLGVDDCVSLCGNRPNPEILKIMSEHDIFLFTSDRHEGWGAVVNEAMSSGCCVVASNEIGSVPFLIKDGENGLIFRDQSVESLTEKVQGLFEDRERMALMKKQAVETMCNVWSPHVAASRLLDLIDALKLGRPTPFVDGPCSQAEPIRSEN